jgi:hypothetical protein
MRIAQPLVSEPSAYEVEMAIEKFRRHRLSSNDLIPAKLITAGGSKIYSEIHKLINSVWNKKELPDQWKESIIIPVYKKGNKTNCSNNRDTSLLSTTYKTLSNILLSRLTRYAEEIIGYHQCGFRRNRSTTDHIFCIRQILEKKWEYNGAVHQLFIDFKKVYDSVRREVLYNILVEFGIPLKLVRLIRMCLGGTYSRVRVGKHLSDRFSIKNGFKKGEASSILLFNSALECAIRKVQVHEEGLKLNGTHQLLVYADFVNLLVRSIHTIRKNTEALVIASKEIGLEVNTEKTKYMGMSYEQKTGQNGNIEIGNKSFETVEQITC